MLCYATLILILPISAMPYLNSTFSLPLSYFYPNSNPNHDLPFALAGMDAFARRRLIHSLP